MAQIVCIAQGTYREGLNNIGDIVSIHDDDVGLTGKAYDSFKIIQVDGVTASELQVKFGSLQPEQAVAFRTDKDAGVWGLTRPEEKQVWNDNGVWKELAKRPKYGTNLSSVDEASLVDTGKGMEALTPLTKIATLESSAVVNLKTFEENQVEVADLNK
jgi:hypothetical protein